MKIRHALAFVAAAGCGSGTPCPGSVVSSNLDDGGSASIVLGTNVKVQASQFVWQNGSPVRFPSASFQINFNTGQGGVSTWIGCSLDWAKFNAATQPVSLTNVSNVFCVVDVARPNRTGGFDVLGATLNVGTIAMTAALDASGNGTLTLQLDVPSTALVLISENLQEIVHVEMIGMRATVVFGTQDCPVSCSGGIYPMI